MSARILPVRLKIGILDVYKRQISNVASIMKAKVNSISTFRAQLINKGLIYATDYAEIDFTVPQFDGFLKRINPDLKIK